MERLRELLYAIDGQGYKAYKRLCGDYAFAGYRLRIDHVQGDPFAAPSRIIVNVPLREAAYPPGLWQGPVRRVACEDYIGRAIADAIGAHVTEKRGIGRSGEVRIATSGQQVLRRNAVLFGADVLEARLTVGLPARDRRISAGDALAIFFDELPRVVHSAMHYSQQPAAAVAKHVATVEDQAWLRDWLDAAGLVAFVADGARLARCSGVDDSPLQEGAITFQSPPSLAVEATLPNAGTIRGMGIPRGVTLIVGGGFHGKSTLLHALERSVYDHIPGDGREQVASVPDSVKVRAEDGRAVGNVDISPFIDNLPLGRDTRHFTTSNASGSTSQAAAIVEAVAAGSRLLLLDEDTAATNFMIRDARMQRLVSDDKEPITPFLHRVRELYTEQRVSTIVVMGGSGDYFAVADTVIMMDCYRPRDVTRAARDLAGTAPAAAAHGGWRPASHRHPRLEDLDATAGRAVPKIEVRGPSVLRYGDAHLDMRALEQLVDADQLRSIGWIMNYYARHAAPQTGVVENLSAILDEVARDGLDVLTPYTVGDLALPRLQEAVAAINRLRGVRWV